jgi:alpha-amylase
MGKQSDVSQASVVNEWDNFIVQLKFYEACQLWYAPIETVSMSEAGFERVYQASSMLPHWQIKLKAGDQTKLKLGLCADMFKEQ